MPLIIGLTGGIGSGKTAASNLFTELGIDIVDADVVAREVVMPGTPALNEISTHFGQQVLQEDGALDRAQLRSIIFQNPEQKQWLESLLHPLIRDSIKNQLAQARSAYAILVSPLLLETNQRDMVQRILVIDVPSTLQVERTTKRDNNSVEQVQAIMAAQSDRAFKQQHADDIILNDKDLGHLQQQILAMHEYYLQMAASA